MLKFIRGLPAEKADQHLKTADHAMEMARQNAILWFGEIHRRKLYYDLGYSSMLLYAQEGLGWSQSKAYDFLKICEKLDELPVVKKKVEEGKLGYARTRTIVSVASPENEKEWVDLAMNKSRTQLKEAARKARRKAAEVAKGQESFLPEETLPTAVVSQRVTLEMTPTQLARYEALWEKLRKQGGLPGDKVEALLALMQSGISNPLENSAAPPVQIHVHQCPDCEKATVQTARGELTLSPEETARIQCDAQISEPGHRNTTSIPPKTRRLVLARDRHRCQTPGCHHNHYLEIHHIIPRARGGTNAPENLTTLCSACHALAHRENSRVGEAPVTYGTAPTHLLPSPAMVHYYAGESAVYSHLAAGSENERSEQHRGNPGLRHRHGAKSRRSVHGDCRAGPERAQPEAVPVLRRRGAGSQVQARDGQGGQAGDRRA